MLFAKYASMLKVLDRKGWQPVPFASTNDSLVLVERYGVGGPNTQLYFTVRNTGSVNSYVNVSVDVNKLDVYSWTVTSMLGTSALLGYSQQGSGVEWMRLRVLPGTTQVVLVSSGPGTENSPSHCFITCIVL